MFLYDLPSMNAIKVGNLFLKPRDIEVIIANSCRMQLFESTDRSLPLGRGGSATLIRYKNIDYVVTTRHQVGMRNGLPLSRPILETIRVASPNDTTLLNVPLKSVHFENSNPDEEFHDILFFEVADEWKNKNKESPFFFKLSSFSNLNRQKSFVVGYPNFKVVMGEYLNDFDSERPGTIHMKQALWDCALDLHFVSRAKHYRSFILSREHEIVDGLSGGAVFSLVGTVGDHEIVLDGIVVRAGKNRLQVIDADYLIIALDHATAAR